MFDSLVLDVVIGLVFVYFILSLLCSVMIEGFASLRKWRPKMLFAGIEELIKTDVAYKDANKESILDKLKRNPLFLGETPSYISPRTFVLALLGSLRDHPGINQTATDLKTLKLDSVKDIKQLVEALPQNSYIRQALVPLLDSAKDDLAKAMAGMEKWYEEAMDRVSGWYKRWSQLCALGLGLLVALALNANTFQISKTLYIDQTIRTTLVAAGQEAAKTGFPGRTEDKAEAARDFLEKTIKLPVPQAKEGKGEPSKSVPEKVSKPGAEKPPLLSLPLGWPDFCILLSRKGIFDIYNFLGIFLTALMVTLGSNFWFDLLNRLINLRGAGKKPQPVKIE